MKCLLLKDDIDCVDGDLSRRVLAALTAANIIVILTSFLGTILGFTVTCCDPSNNFRVRICFLLVERNILL